MPWRSFSKMNKPRLIVTRDGSHSLFHPLRGEACHSRHGALQESLHVFIEHGLKYKLRQKETVSVLEIGFGAGLNAWLTAEEAISKKRLIHYVAAEAFPIDEELYAQLNYPALRSFDKERKIFSAIHACPWDEEVTIDPFFIIHKKLGKAEEMVFSNTCDLIYLDAFSPETQPELWSTEFLRSLCQSLKPTGVLVTYCCKGVVKRIFTDLGLKVSKLPGPPGKREMLRAERVAGKEETTVK